MPFIRPIKSASVLLFLALAGARAFAQGEPLPHRSAFNEIYLDWMKGTTPHDKTISDLEHLEAKLPQARAADDLEFRCQLALTKARVLYGATRKDATVKALEAALDFGAKANALKERSDTWRLMAEASSLMMLVKGPIYIMANFSTSQDQAKRALELDPRNVRASLIIAQFLCNAPGIAGGNWDQGVTLLRDQLRSGALSDDDRFALAYSLGLTLADKGMWTDADTWCRQASAIYPGNRDSMALQSRIAKEQGAAP